jgi:hypothetical protein
MILKKESIYYAGIYMVVREKNRNKINLYNLSKDLRITHIYAFFLYTDI